MCIIWLKHLPDQQWTKFAVMAKHIKMTNGDDNRGAIKQKYLFCYTQGKEISLVKCVQ